MGRAGQRLVDLGNVVNPGGSNNSSAANGSSGNNNSMLVIERLDPIYADFTISQNSLTAVQQEMGAGTLRAEVRLPDTGSEAVVGQLTFVDNAVRRNRTGDSSRDDPKCRASVLAGAFCQYSSRTQHHPQRRARSGHRAPDVSQGILCLRRQGRFDR